MILDDLKPYAAYKDSGLPWLGQVPGHWRAVRNGSLFRQRNQTGYAALPILEVSLKTGVKVRDFGKSTRKQVMSDLGKYKRAVKGDLAYNTMRMWQGAVGVCPVDGLVSPAYVVACPYPGVESQFFDALFRTGPYMAEIDNASRGIVKDRNRLYWDQFKQMMSPCPPLDEQAAIVRFLDWANGRLERTIRAKRKVITLLNEQKQAIIHRAVTRGLDPNVPLKASGVAWLGDIPQHWDLRTLKRACKRSSLYGANVPAERYVGSGVRFLRTTDIDEDGNLGDKIMYISEEDARGYSLDEGDFIVSRSGTVGRALVYRANVHGACAYAGYLVRFVMRQDDLQPEFLWCFTKTPAFASFLKSVAIASTIENVNGEKYSNMPIALPPVAEQTEILAWIGKRSAPIDTTISRLHREIELLREYRTRLVADVVTGKLDVRKAAARLPTIDTESPIESDSADVEEESDELIEDEA